MSRPDRLIASGTTAVSLLNVYLRLVKHTLAEAEMHLDERELATFLDIVERDAARRGERTARARTS